MPPKQKRGVVANARYQRVNVRAIAAAAAKAATKSKTVKAVKKRTLTVAEDVSATIQRGLQDRNFIMLVIAVVALYSFSDLKTGPFADLFPPTCTNTFCKWVRANVGKFFGGLTYLPVAMTLQPDKRPAFVLASAVFIFFVPESTIYQYGVQALLLYLYFHVALKDTKTFLIFAAVGIYFGGWLIKKEMDGVSTENTTTVDPDKPIETRRSQHT
jgi:hypothetical protein